MLCYTNTVAVKDKNEGPIIETLGVMNVQMREMAMIAMAMSMKYMEREKAMRGTFNVARGRQGCDRTDSSTDVFGQRITRTERCSVNNAVQEKRGKVLR